MMSKDGTHYVLDIDRNALLESDRFSPRSNECGHADNKTNKRLKANVMFKVLASLLFFGGLFSVSASTYASGPSQQTVVPDSETIIVKSGNLKEFHDSASITTVDKTVYCEGHVISLEATSNVRKTSSERNATYRLEGDIDGRSLDFSDAEMLVHSKQSDFDFGFKTDCLNAMIAIEIYAYASGDIRSSRVGRLYVDLESGEVLDEPRRAPPSR